MLESRSKTKSATGVPCAVIYHPRRKALRKIIPGNLYFLYINDEVKANQSVYTKPYIPILLTVRNNISQTNVIKRVKSLISYDTQLLRHW